jgi:GTP pyrophosphokinase
MSDQQKPCYGKSFDDALAYAAEAFRHTTRKATGIPYITHLLAVTALVGEHGGSEEQMIAALLHDVLEDVEGSTKADLAKRFGTNVAEMVEALSDATERPKPAWKERKTRYLARLEREDAQVKLVSAADKLHNLRSTLRDLDREGASLWARFNAGREEQIWYYRSAVQALAKDWDHPLVEELRMATESLEKS